jgi:hypothetical protein
MLHFEGGGESVILLEGSRASPVHPSHKSESEDVGVVLFDLSEKCVKITSRV